MRPHLTDHVFTVPLDHDDPAGPAIEVYAREAVDPAQRAQKLPWLLYLQGGPGGKSPRPLGATPGWLAHALQTHRVLLLDQRGTGRSTPITAAAAARFPTGHSLARHLALHRADSIVRDAELIRQALCGDEPWETIGQSYGGFLTLTYLSQAPEGLRACYITGGLPGLDASADDVYARTLPRIAAKNVEFYRRHPQHRQTVRRIADLLTAYDVRLPDGDRLTPERFRLLGLAFGMGDGFDRVHYLLEDALDEFGRLTDVFLHQVLQQTGFVENPLFVVLQEACYGHDGKPTSWAAERALTASPEFAADADPLLFTGETMFPWMLRQIRGLRPFAEAADLLTAKTDWPTLYDPRRLAANPVPVAAVIYHDDMYVDAELSLQTLRNLGSARAWITNEWEHDGVTASGGAVLARLMDMAAGRI